MRLGGWPVVDDALDVLMEPLSRNPYEFRVLENDFFRVRYAIIDGIGGSGSLVVCFEIDPDGNVEITHVEPTEAY